MQHNKQVRYFYYTYQWKSTNCDNYSAENDHCLAMKDHLIGVGWIGWAELISWSILTTLD